MSDEQFYQSGQAVNTPGTYEVVGVATAAGANKSELAIRVFQVGELFPNYQGRAVSWHWVQQSAEKPSAASSSKA